MVVDIITPCEGIRPHERDRARRRIARALVEVAIASWLEVLDQDMDPRDVLPAGDIIPWSG